MRIIITAILAAVVAVPNAMAGPSPPAGNPAGVKRAMIVSEKREAFILGEVLIAGVAAGVAMVGKRGSDAAVSTGH
jgi:hypothetical protein